MEVFERALHDEVIAEGGTDLAKRMGVNRTRLLDCANPNREEHRMNLQMFGQVLAHVSEEGRQRVLQALVGEFGFELVAKEQPKARDLSAAMLHVTKEFADVARSVSDAMDDGRISQHERAQIAREINEARHSLDVMAASVKVA